MSVRLGEPVPRVFTPPLAPLEPRTPETEARTLGYRVIDFARDALEIDLFPWQEWFFIHALELRDGHLRFRTVLLLVARQNGKSTISLVLALFVLYALRWKTVLSTAQDLDTAEEIWGLAVEQITETDENEDGDEVPLRPWLAEQVDRIIAVNGKKGLALKGRRRWKVKTAGRRAGRGFTADLILADELREHQTWQAWAAITKTTQTRPHALIFGMSNAGDKLSVVLAELRRQAHLALGDPDGLGDRVADVEVVTAGAESEAAGAEQAATADDALAIFEWSAEPGCATDDVDQIAQANPSLGHLIPLRTILADQKTDPEWVFRTEVLCQWPDGLVDGPYRDGVWEACANQFEVQPDGTSRLADDDQIVGDMVACLSSSKDGGVTHLVVAGYRRDGLPQVELRATRSGTEWVKPFLLDPKVRARITHLTAQERGAPVSALLSDLQRDDEVTTPIIPWGGPPLPQSYTTFEQLLNDGLLRHNDQPALTAAAMAAKTRYLGAVKVIDLRGSEVDAAPLIGAVGAVWLLRNKPEKEEIQRPPKVAAVASTTATMATTDDVLAVRF